MAIKSFQKHAVCIYIQDRACFDSLKIDCFITTHGSQLRARTLWLNEANVENRRVVNIVQQHLEIYTYMYNTQEVSYKYIISIIQNINFFVKQNISIKKK